MVCNRHIDIAKATAEDLVALSPYMCARISRFGAYAPIATQSNHMVREETNTDYSITGLHQNRPRHHVRVLASPGTARRTLGGRRSRHTGSSVTGLSYYDRRSTVEVLRSQG
ncbi:hypothetical protein ACFWTE_06315 [Nocardiopsis sp. NPDC058631]|uniref:hypothetical protein n=1 Tax=Nocardiopsis sp. NPDC058631 TaxID=3346566 RepID=UPI00364952CE